MYPKITEIYNVDLNFKTWLYRWFAYKILSNPSKNQYSKNQGYMKMVVWSF